MRAAPRHVTLDSFWSWVDSSGDGCWPWMGTVTARGYGRARICGKPWAAHRLAYLLAGHTIPDGEELHHTCENKRCCCPSHLQAVTRREHIAAHLRKRQVRYWRWEFVLRRPATESLPASHFGIVGFVSRWQAEGAARRWSRFYPAFTTCEVKRYRATADGYAAARVAGAPHIAGSDLPPAA